MLVEPFVIQTSSISHCRSAYVSTCRRVGLWYMEVLVTNGGITRSHQSPLSQLRVTLAYSSAYYHLYTISAIALRMTADSLGPRRTALLEAWSVHAATEASGPGFDFTENNRTNRSRDLVDAFIADPTEERFEVLWSRDVLSDAVVGGPGLVLKRWASVDELATGIEQIRRADAYDPDWESRFPMKTAVWELYGRLHPETAPILYSESCRGLEYMGFSLPRTFADAETEWLAFKRVYESHVGHATKGTDHEAPLHHEICEFLQLIANPDEDAIVDLLQSDEEYQPLTGWRDELPLKNDIGLRGHVEHVEGYIEAKKRGGFERDGPKNLWNEDHWEVWKEEYREHVRTVVEPRYDLTNLSADELEPLFDDLNESVSISTPIPTHMLGGRHGGILWGKFKARTFEHPEEAAAVLSYLFEEDEDLDIRLDRFGRFYGQIDPGGGALLSLATILLTFVYPREYVFYKWSEMASFFGDFADYNVNQGYNTTQYWKLNLACKEQMLSALDRELEGATLLDVHSLLYVYKRKYASSKR